MQRNAEKIWGKQNEEKTQNATFFRTTYMGNIFTPQMKKYKYMNQI